MHNVIIVDDEKWALEGFKSSINWEAAGFNISKTYNSGFKALTYLEKDNPDLLITDIKMPRVNGIDLLKHAKKINPDIEVLLVSGHRDFSYARDALLNGASGYILKPYDKKDIYNNLTMIKGKLQNREINLFKKLIEQKSLSIIPVLEKKGIVLNGLEKYSIIVSNKILTNNKSFPYKNGTYLTFIQQDIKSIIDDYIIIGGVTNLKYAKDLYKGIQLAYDFYQSHYIRRNETRFIRHIKWERKNLNFASDLIDLVETKKREQIEIFFNKMQCNIISKEGDITNILKFYNTMVSFLTLKNRSKLGYITSAEDLIKKYPNIKDLLSEIREEIRSLTQVPSMLFPPDYNNYLVSQTIEIINNNFKNQVNIQEIAHDFSTSPSYLSQVFKKETGQTIINYLTTLRIDEAKDLLISTRETVSIISDMVGYQDYFYFTKIFKKHIGVSPSKYRKSLL